MYIFAKISEALFSCVQLNNDQRLQCSLKSGKLVTLKHLFLPDLMGPHSMSAILYLVMLAKSVSASIRMPFDHWQMIVTEQAN